MLITKEEAPKQNKRMKLLDLLQKSTHKKEQEMQDMQVEKLQFLLVVVLHMVQKGEIATKLEN